MSLQAPLDTRPHASTARVAVAALAFCCIGWGLSFPVMQISTHALERAIAASGTTLDGGAVRLKLATTATFNAWRFALAAAAFALLSMAQRRRPAHADLRGGAGVGLFLGLGMFMQLAGLQYALPSVSSFLTALPVVLAPLAQAWLLRRPPGRQTWLAVAIALLGIGVLWRANPQAVAAHTLTSPPPLPHLGEILTVLGSFLFTAQILTLDRVGKAAHPTHLTAAALATTALANLAGGLTLGAAPLYNLRLLSLLASDFTFLWSMATLVLFCSVVAMYLMNIHQPRVTPATASVIYCLEPVFATLFSVLLQTERLTPLTVAGGATILAAVLIVAQAPADDRD